MIDTRARSSLDFLAWALGECRTARTTGSLYLAGRPGGVVHLREGHVIAIDGPAALGADSLLLRSGRISETDWSAVLCAAAGGTAPHGELLARTGIGGAELRLVTTMAAQDGAFAVVAGTIDEYAVDLKPLDVPLPLAPALDPGLLPAETARRIDALASLPTPVSRTGVVDLATGMLPAVETTDAHPPEVLDLPAGATLDLFQGRTVVMIEDIFKERRGVASSEHYFQEILVNSANLTPLFIRNNQNAVVVCPKAVNIGMLFAGARRVVKSLEF